MTIILNQTLNPVNPQERVKINQNWDRIISGLTQLQLQVNVLAGGQQTDVLLARIEQAITDANNGVARIDASIAQGEQAQLDAIARITQLTQEVQDLSTQAMNLVSNNNQALQLIQQAEDARVQAEMIRVNNELTREALINNLTFVGEYDRAITYVKNNMVLYNGSTYASLRNVTGMTPNNNGTDWRLVAQRGVDGNGAVSTVNGVAPDAQGNIDLNSVFDAPSQAEFDEHTNNRTNRLHVSFVDASVTTYNELGLIVQAQGTTPSNPSTPPANDYAQRIIDLEQGSQAFRTDLNTNTQSIMTVQSAVNSNTGNITINRTDLDATIARVTQNEADIADIRANGGGGGSTPPDLTPITDRLDAVEGRATVLEGDLGTTITNVTALTGDLTTVSGRVTALGSDVTALNGRVTTSEARIVAVENTVTTHTGEIASLKTFGDSTRNDLATAISNKGVATNATDPFSTIISNINAIPTGGGTGVRVNSGTLTSTSSAISLSTRNNSNTQNGLYTVEFNTVGFVPSYIELIHIDASQNIHRTTYKASYSSGTVGTITNLCLLNSNTRDVTSTQSSNLILDGAKTYVSGGTFKLPVTLASTQYQWIAYS